MFTHLKTPLMVALVLATASPLPAQSGTRAQIGIEHETVFVFDKQLTTQQIRDAWSLDGMLEHAESWLVENQNSPQKKGFVVVSGIRPYLEVFHSQDLDYEGILTLNEFSEPTKPGFSGDDSYPSILKRIQINEGKEAESYAQQIRLSYREVKGSDESFGRESIKEALLGSIMKHHHLRIVPFAYGTLPAIIPIMPRREFEETSRPLMTGSYHISITMPRRPDNSELEAKEALYAAYVLQWLEPLIVAVAASGDPSIPLRQGVQGSFRLLNNIHSAAGKTHLKWCDSAIGDSRYCIDPINQYNGLGHARSGLSPQCYMNLVRKGKVTDYEYRKHTAIDLKGKSVNANAADYENGFELRVFDNMKIERFLPNIQLFSLAVTHAQASVSQFGKNNQYVNFFNPNENQSPLECGPCNARDYSIPCNQWQIAMASVLQRGYRARLTMAFISALEKNLSLNFWHTPNTTHAYAFEIADALSSELQRRNGKNPLLIALLGDPLKSKPALAKMGLEEWASYFTAPEQTWHTNWRELQLDASRATQTKMWSRQSFLDQVLTPHFDWSWTNAYDDILFLLEHLGKIKLVTHNGEIISIY